MKNNKMTFKKLFINYNYIFMFVILLIVCTIISHDFLTYVNVSNLLRQNAGLCIIAMGALMVILTGGIDLSVANVSALCGVTTAWTFANAGTPFGVSVLLAILVGAAMGAVSGLLSAYAKMAPFIATLAIQTVAHGLALMVTNGAPITVPTDRIDVQKFGSGFFLGLPSPFWLSVIVIVITLFVLKKVAFGRIITAIGSNESAVRLSGINTKKHIFAVYVISGVLSAVGGVITVCRTGVGSPTAGTGWDLDSIASVVIGGASLAGGKGSAIGAVIGVFILAFITNIMNLLGVPSYPQEVIRGVIIIAAVLLQMLDSKEKK